MTRANLDSPLISVVIPLHNKADDVGRAVRSVLAQVVSDFELIVVNDGSTDGSERVVGRFGDARIRIVDQLNAGEGAARNRGVQEARADLVAFCDADDEWMPAFLETVLKLERSFPYCSVFATNFVIRERNGGDLAPIRAGLHGDGSEGVLKDYFRTASKSGTPWFPSSVAVRKEAMLAVGGFPTGVRVGADLLGWARLASAYQIAISTSPQAIFYLRGAYPSPPVRIPDIPDVVGEELARMVIAAPNGQRAPLRRYAGMWHRGRAIMFIYRGRRSDAHAELRAAIRYSPGDKRLYALVVLTFVPTRLRDVALSAVGRWKARQRRLR